MILSLVVLIVWLLLFRFAYLLLLHLAVLRAVLKYDEIREDYDDRSDDIVKMIVSCRHGHYRESREGRRHPRQDPAKL